MSAIPMIAVLCVIASNAFGSEPIQLSDLAANLKRLEALVLSQETAFEAKLKEVAQTLNDKIDTVIKRQSELKKTAMTDVAFSAYRSDPESYAPGATVVFPAFWANLGDHYDISTGIFTCPVVGLYYFSYSVYILDASRFELELVRDGSPFAVAYAHDDGLDQGSISVIILCNSGDQVWVRQGSPLSSKVVELTEGANNIASAFKGFLLSELVSRT